MPFSRKIITDEETTKTTSLEKQTTTTSKKLTVTSTEREQQVLSSVLENTREDSPSSTTNATRRLEDISIESDDDQNGDIDEENLTTSSSRFHLVNSSSSLSSFSKMPSRKFLSRGGINGGGSGGGGGHHADTSMRINCTHESEQLTRKKRITVIARSLACILVYYVFSIGLTFYNRYLFTTYNYPLTITLVHLVFKLVTASIVRVVLTTVTKKKRVLLDARSFATRLLPTSLTSAIDIGFSNWSLQYITVSLYTMSKSSVILFILFFSILFKLEKWVKKKNSI